MAREAGIAQSHKTDMGIDYIIVNLDKKECLDFDRLGFGTKRGQIILEPIAPFVMWLLIGKESSDDPATMVGRWAGNRIILIGDHEGFEEKENAIKQCKDITVETIQGFAAGNPFEVITMFQPLGLIDQDGKVVTDSKKRDLIAQYWKEKQELENKQWFGSFENELSDLSKSLADLANLHVSSPAAAISSIVAERRVWLTTPLKDLSTDALWQLLKTGVGQDFLIPLAMKRLESDPTLFGLLTTVLKCHEFPWNHYPLERLRGIVDRALADLDEWDASHEVSIEAMQQKLPILSEALALERTLSARVAALKLRPSV